MRYIKSKYAKVDIERGIIYLIDDRIFNAGLNYDLLAVVKDVDIKISEGILVLEGERFEWSYAYGRRWIESTGRKPLETFIEYKYKNIVDFFRDIKKPSVKGDFMYEDTVKYKVEMNKWVIVYK